MKKFIVEIPEDALDEVRELALMEELIEEGDSDIELVQEFFYMEGGLHTEAVDIRDRVKVEEVK